ncbi:hypothetical protein LWM68_09605 [Niabella sp. W65]|nr:hypothetical protein [Niabella sp. W65]MCH7363001.1 hypothetical protein [Niabella sp. W65]ULT38938.1 hypothetical protein KRR40_28275 [Niabella sp. I65]
MNVMNEYVLSDTNISNLSVFDLLKHTAHAGFMEQENIQDIYPLTIELNTGIFTRDTSAAGFPEVTVSQFNDSVYASCSCNNPSGKLCVHQAEVIYCILEQNSYRIFFDNKLRHAKLLAAARNTAWRRNPTLIPTFICDITADRSI